MNKSDWSRGYWQADADLATEGNILTWYTRASPSFRAGYKARVKAAQS